MEFDEKVLLLSADPSLAEALRIIKEIRDQELLQAHSLMLKAI